MLDNQDQTARKQEFLRREIVEKNYSPLRFYEFLVAASPASGSEDAQNLQNWKMQDLERIVIAFKQYYAHMMESGSFTVQQEKPAVPTVSQQFQPDVTMAEFILPETTCAFSVVPETGMSHCQLRGTQEPILLKTHQKTRTHEPSFNLTKEFAILNLEHRVVRTNGFFCGIGASTSVFIDFKTNLQSSRLITRLMADFVLLRDVLRIRYPGYYLPPLNLSLVQTSEPAKLQQYTLAVGVFLDELSKGNQLLFNNSTVHSFLTLEDNYPQFRTNLKEKQRLPQIVSETWSLTGKTKIDISEQVHATLQQIEKNNLKVNRVAEIVQQQTSKLHQYFKKISDSFQTIGSSLQSLKLDINVNQSSSIYEVFCNALTTQQSAISDFTKLFAQLQHSYDQRAHSTLACLEQVFRKLRQQTQTFHRQILAPRAAHEQNYVKAKIDLSLKKKEWMSKGKPSTSNSQVQQPSSHLCPSLFPVESELEYRKRQWLGYINAKAVQQYSSLVPKQSQMLSKAFKTWCSKWSNLCLAEILSCQRIVNAST